MLRIKYSFLNIVILLLAAAAVYCGIMCAALPSYADEGQSEGLKYLYTRLEPLISKSPLGLPLHFESRVENDFSGVDIYGVIDFPIETLQRELSKPKNWCDIIILHPNIRACTYSGNTSGSVLVMHNVNRHFQAIAEAYQMLFKYQIIQASQSFLDIAMNADSGPFGSYDHKLRLRAVALDVKRSFVHLSYSYTYGSIQYLAMKSYFALFGVRRAGFSIDSFDEKSGPIYVSGVKGAVERNVMRYFLAILAYFDAMKYPQEQRFEKRLSGWIELSGRYKEQFPKVENEQYFDFKRVDLKNQTLLQAGIGAR